ncbi:uncharacterized protein LOC122210605 [Panthera leo]|uniref:uncharacterized protein LOC122210605 n=1 Tax=Panthera leo TaxID=9689 RepID=UPI001C695E3A|nr:uncharacterized protein LOC122210605 [Panthera leo]
MKSPGHFEEAFARLFKIELFPAHRPGLKMQNLLDESKPLQAGQTHMSAPQEQPGSQELSSPGPTGVEFATKALTVKAASSKQLQKQYRYIFIKAEIPSHHMEKSFSSRFPRPTVDFTEHCTGDQRSVTRSQKNEKMKFVQGLGQSRKATWFLSTVPSLRRISIYGLMTMASLLTIKVSLGGTDLANHMTSSCCPLPLSYQG